MFTIKSGQFPFVEVLKGDDVQIVLYSNDDGIVNKEIHTFDVIATTDGCASKGMVSEVVEVYRASGTWANRRELEYTKLVASDTPVYDKYGRIPSQYDYEDETELSYFTVDDSTTANTRYFCFFNAATRMINRVTKTETGYIYEHAYGAWADRVSLTYTPINDPIAIVG